MIMGMPLLLWPPLFYWFLVWFQPAPGTVTHESEEFMLSLIFSLWVLLVTALLCGIFLALMLPGGSPFVPFALVASVAVASMVVALSDILSLPLWTLAVLWAGFLLILYRLPLPHREEGDDRADERFSAFQEDPQDIAYFFDFEEVN